MKTPFHQGFFPPPGYLALRSIGLDISDTSIKYISLKPAHGQIELDSFGSVPITPGTVVNGKIQNRDALVKLLRELRQKTNSPFVRVSLPEEQVYLFDLHIPAVPLPEVRNTIELSLEEHIPLKPSDAVFDFFIQKVHNDQYDVKVSATSSEVTESYYAVLADAGFVPTSFELEAQAVARAIVPRGDLGTVMIIDFGETRTGISIWNAGAILFSAAIDIGGQELTKAVQKALNVSFEEADRIKREQGLSRSDDGSDVFPALLNSISIFRDEINKHYIYWHTHTDAEGGQRPKVDEIVLCGGGARLIGLVDYLGVSLGVRVLLADPWVNINTMQAYIPEIHKEEVLAYTTALGLALCDYSYD